jgi:hypothetical protein
VKKFIVDFVKISHSSPKFQPKFYFPFLEETDAVPWWKIYNSLLYSLLFIFMRVRKYHAHKNIHTCFNMPATYGMLPVIQ